MMISEHDKQAKLDFLKQYRYKKAVYAILRDGHVFYVGLSSDVGERIRRHLSNHGFECDFLILQKICNRFKNSSVYCHNLEWEWIIKYKKMGAPLINIQYCQEIK